MNERNRIKDSNKGLTTVFRKVSFTQIAHILVPFIQNGGKKNTKLIMNHN